MSAFDPFRRFAAVDYCIAKGPLDHLVSTTKKRERNGEAERLGRLLLCRGGIEEGRVAVRSARWR